MFDKPYRLWCHHQTAIDFSRCLCTDTWHNGHTPLTEKCTVVVWKKNIHTVICHMR